MRLRFFLFFALIISTMVVVNVSYEERKLFQKMESLRKEADFLKEEENRLETQKRQLSETGRIQREALKNGMVMPNPAVTVYVSQ